MYVDRLYSCFTFRPCFGILTSRIWIIPLLTPRYFLPIFNCLVPIILTSFYFQVSMWKFRWISPVDHTNRRKPLLNQSEKTQPSMKPSLSVYPDSQWTLVILLSQLWFAQRNISGKMKFMGKLPLVHLCMHAVMNSYIGRKWCHNRVSLSTGGTHLPTIWACTCKNRTAQSGQCWKPIYGHNFVYMCHRIMSRIVTKCLYSPLFKSYGRLLIYEETPIW